MTTLEKLSAYLPYQLMCWVDKNKKARMDSVYADGTCTFHELVESEKGFKYITPMLKPIREADSYLRDEFSKYFRSEECDNEAIDLFCYEKLGKVKLLSELDLLKKLPYDSIQWLLKNHYDVFGMIEAGEAIELI